MVVAGIGFAAFSSTSAITGGVLYAYYTQLECDPYRAGYITNVNQVFSILKL